MQSQREHNSEDGREIEKLNGANDQKGKESVEYAARIRAYEYDIAKSLSRIEDLSRIIDQKNYDLKNKEATLVEAEKEVLTLKSQQTSYQKELEHLKALDERYRSENADL